MKQLFFYSLLIGLAISSSFAQTPAPTTPEPSPFSIREIKRVTRSQAYVENAWKQNVPCIQATIQSSEDLDSHRIVKAYLFDRDKKLVMKYDKPSLVTSTGGTASMPDFVKAKERCEVHFALPERAQSGSSKWSRIVVVFGKGKQVVAAVYPADDFTAFAFPEKSFAVPNK